MTHFLQNIGVTIIRRDGFLALSGVCQLLWPSTYSLLILTYTYRQDGSTIIRNSIRSTMACWSHSYRHSRSSRYVLLQGYDWLIARGKTHISRALERYLRWLGVKARVYSLGDYRRKVLGGAENVPSDYFQTHGQFPAVLDAERNWWIVEGRTEATNALRRRIKNELEEQILDYYTNQGGQVVILDANNGNVANRKETYQKFESKGVHVIFLGKSTCPIWIPSRYLRESW